MKDIIHFAEDRSEYCLEVKPGDCSIVIFGASGDLTKRKIIPALFGLFRRELLPEHFLVLGCGRVQMETETFRELFRSVLLSVGSSASVDRFLDRLHYQRIDYQNTDQYLELGAFLQSMEKRYHVVGPRVFYLATPPDLILPISTGLCSAGLSLPDTGREGRMIIEKPFGRDLNSAAGLNKALAKVWPETGIYRIDHYLGKETVQNILILRFANIVFEPVWNRQYIDHVQITVAESDGVGTRASYYEQAGVLRDMFQNHMLQMLALVGMEPPATLSAERYREEKMKLLRAIRPFGPDAIRKETVRGQYIRGNNGYADQRAYRDEPGVFKESSVETSVAMKLWIDNWRWQGVPFYMRSGKRWPKRKTEIAVVFRQVSHSIFSALGAHQLANNTLVLKIQPAEGMGLMLEAKRPGPRNCMSALMMDFDYKDVSSEPTPDAYERLLLDCMTGDRTLFVSAEEVELAWSLLQPILDNWSLPDGLSPLRFYPAGTPGPNEADQLIELDGRKWRPV